jgi:hypothetical protein
MTSYHKSSNSIKNQRSTPRHQDFTTYKDFTSDKSLESADFDDSFREVNHSFYSSSNEEHADSILMNLQPHKEINPERKSKNKEEETNYTVKPVLILDKEEIKKSLWCGNCMFRGNNSHGCLSF